jgi:hypothetical protein
MSKRLSDQTEPSAKKMNVFRGADQYITRCCEMCILNYNNTYGNKNNDIAKAFIDQFRIMDDSVKEDADVTQMNEK